MSELTFNSASLLGIPTWQDRPTSVHKAEVAEKITKSRQASSNSKSDSFYTASSVAMKDQSKKKKKDQSALHLNEASSSEVVKYIGSILPHCKI